MIISNFFYTILFIFLGFYILSLGGFIQLFAVAFFYISLILFSFFMDDVILFFEDVDF